MSQHDSGDERHRSIWQVLLIYLGTSWGVLQVVDQVQNRLSLPNWVYGVALVLLLIGLPIILATALVQQRRNPRISIDNAPLPVRVLTWRNAIGGGLMAFIVGGAALTLWLNFTPAGTRRDRAEAAQPSIAVLPFVDMSAAHDQEFFGDGITEEILNVLAQVPNLRVPARTSSFSFKGKNLPIKEIAAQLGVANILEGSLRKSGNRVRITAQLIDAKTDQHLWSETYDRDVSDVFAVQDEIAHAIVDALQLKIAEKLSKETLVAKQTSDAGAHELYLKGLYYWHRRHADELPMSLSLMQDATKADPNYAAAWAGLALAYAVVPQYVLYDRATAIREGKAAAARALALAPRNADAEAALGQIASELEFDWDAATKHLARAVEFDAQNATAHQWRAEVLAQLGQYSEAQSEIDRALVLDPLSSVIQNVRAVIYRTMGDCDKAIVILKGITERDPDYPFARTNLMVCYLISKRYAEAGAIARTPEMKQLATLLEKNDRTAAMEMLANNRDRFGIFGITTYLSMGEDRLAAAGLRHAIDAPTRSGLAYYARSPISQRLQQYPEFQEYRRLVHL